MKRVFLALALLCAAGTTYADTDNLEGGVFIAHYPAALQFSSDPPLEGWCQHYLDNYLIKMCKDQVNRIDTKEGAIWFVLAAWTEKKEWCATEFGFEAYDPDIFAFTDWGPCFPGVGLELPGAMWPGPEEGTAIAVAGAAREGWSGNFLPVYFFAGYAYAKGIIPLSVDPNTGFGGTANCATAPGAWSADAFGGMGLFTDGIYTCPGGRNGDALPKNLKLDSGGTEHGPATLFVCANPGSTPALRLAIGERAWVTLKVYDVGGRLISTLQDGHLAPGTYERTWSGLNQDGHRVPAGSYTARFEVNGNLVDQRRITIIP